MEETTRKGDLSVSKGVKTGLSRRQKEAIPFLLGAKSVEEGCRNAGLSKATVFRWLRQDDFRAEVQRQREAVTTEALQRLKASITAAVDTLVALTGSQEESIRLRAAQQIIDFCLKIRDGDEIESRLERVEKIILERKIFR